MVRLPNNPYLATRFAPRSRFATMDLRQLTQLRIDLLKRRATGEITKSEYDEMLAELSRLEAESTPRPVPQSYTPTLQETEVETKVGIPIPPALKPGTLLDKYELKSSKRGGMGEVWKAWDAKADRWVAVKLLPQELRGNAEEIARIRGQFKLVEQLDHPHICRLFDLNEHPVWGWYEVMRWIDGETLAQIAANAGGKLPLSELIALLTPVAEALDYAHRKQILHRDMKPLNVMRSKEGVVQVIDFGLAAAVEGCLSRVSRKSAGISGTPQYLAPELWNEAPESAKSDQYALGVTAYELLAGRPPFMTDNLSILMARIQTADVPAIAGVSSEAMAVLRQTMAKDSGHRFESCVAFIKALANPPVVRIALPELLTTPFSANDAAARQRDWARHLRCEVYEKNSLGMELAIIPPGSFKMGSPDSEKDRRDNEGPVMVTLTRPAWVGRTPVTREQWTAVMGSSPWQGKLFVTPGVNHPATHLSWENAEEFCQRLTERDAAKWTYRLPTEAEWEWACRAGTQSAFWFGSALNGTQANCDGRFPFGTSQKGPYKQGTTAVGSYEANQFGLWDMHGNTLEWCADGYQIRLPGGEDPVVAFSGSGRVFRGGSWRSMAVYCRSACRRGSVSGDRRERGQAGQRENLGGARLTHLGFRVLAVLSHP
jgi:eukaryotic-like serine/threonine-protein kinase